MTEHDDVNYDDVTKENIKQHNPDCPKTLHHPYIILIIGGSRSRNRNALLNLVRQENDDDHNIIDKI